MNYKMTSCQCFLLLESFWFLLHYPLCPITKSTFSNRLSDFTLLPLIWSLKIEELSSFSNICFSNVVFSAGNLICSFIIWCLKSNNVSLFYFHLHVNFFNVFAFLCNRCTYWIHVMKIWLSPSSPSQRAFTPLAFTLMNFCSFF